MLFIFMVLIVIGSVATFLVMSNRASGSENIVDPNIDQIVNDLTVSTDEITTNIKDDHFAKVNFNIQVSNKNTKDELTKRMFQVKNAVIYTLSGMTAKDLQDQEGISRLENTIKSRVNGFLKSGQVTHVYTTEKVVQ